MLTLNPFCALMYSATVRSALIVAPPLPTSALGSSTVNRNTSLSIHPLACRDSSSVVQKKKQRILK